MAALRSAAAALDRLVDLAEPDVDVIVEEVDYRRHQAAKWCRPTNAWCWMPTS